MISTLVFVCSLKSVVGCFHLFFALWLSMWFIRVRYFCLFVSLNTHTHTHTHTHTQNTLTCTHSCALTSIHAHAPHVQKMKKKMETEQTKQKDSTKKTLRSIVDKFY